MFVKKHGLILLLILVLTAIPLWQQRQLFFTPTNMDESAQKYAHSQYVLGDAAPQKIDDGELYIYAGYAYMQGEDPTTINFEHPPLFKYGFGLSYLIFKNSYVISLIYYGLFLVSCYLFSGLLIKNKLLRAAAVVILALQPAVNGLASQALLDLPLNILVLLLVYLLFSARFSARSRYLGAGLILGLMSGVKYPFPFLILPIALVGIVSLIRKEGRHLVWPAVLLPSIYLAQYLLYFTHGHSLVEFIQFEKYRFVWWVGNRTIPPFLIMQNLFTGQFPAWWEPGVMMKDLAWSLSLPIIFISYLAAFILIKKDFPKLVFYVYSLAVISLYAVGSATYLRYLTQIIPFWIVLVLATVEERWQR